MHEVRITYIMSNPQAYAQGVGRGRHPPMYGCIDPQKYLLEIRTMRDAHISSRILLKHRLKGINLLRPYGQQNVPLGTYKHYIDVYGAE
jgi:hypothetical protein